ncbi:hypothetical protein GGI12_001305, partial [Dipsacomyces acuminosporus]
ADAQPTRNKAQEGTAMFFSPQAVRPVRTAGTQSPPPLFGLGHAESSNSSRMKPRSYTTSGDPSVNQSLQPASFVNGYSKLGMSGAPIPASSKSPPQPRHKPLPRKPRVSSMYVGSDMATQLQAEVEKSSVANASGLRAVESADDCKTPRQLKSSDSSTSSPTAQGPRSASEMANAAIRDFVEMKASWSKNDAPKRTTTASSVTNSLPSNQSPALRAAAAVSAGLLPQASRTHPAPTTAESSAARVMDIAPHRVPAKQHTASNNSYLEKSELIEFIEKRRAKTFAADGPAFAGDSLQPTNLAKPKAATSNNFTRPIATPMTKKKVTTAQCIESRPIVSSAFHSDTETESHYSSSTANSISLAAAIASTNDAQGSDLSEKKHTERSGSVSSKRSESSERKYTRSTARLADVDPNMLKANTSDSSSKGLNEGELLELAVQHKDGAKDRKSRYAARQSASSEHLQIADQTFIETQYVETRESSQEADYFRQLMDIERSMENTTIALGFELKRTQAKYLQQAADFIREQMAKFQAEGRPESRISLAPRSATRASVASPIASPTFPVTADASGASSSLHKPSPTSSVESLVGGASNASNNDINAAESKAQHPLQPPATTPPEPPIADIQEQLPPTSASPSLARDNASSDKPETPADTSVDSDTQKMKPSHSGSGTISSIGQPTQRKFSETAAAASLPKRLVNAPSAFSPHLAHHVSATIGHTASSPVKTSPLSAGGSEGRYSALARILSPTGMGFASSAGSASSDNTEPANSAIPIRSPKSPRSALTSGFFSAGPETVSAMYVEDIKAVSAEDAAAAAAATSSTHTQVSSASINIPIKKKPADNTVAASMSPSIKTGGLSYRHPDSGRRQDEVPRSSTPTKSSTMHWPPRSPHRSPRPASTAIDLQTFTAEELLESLKLPMISGNTLGPSSRSGTPTSPRTPIAGGSLGRTTRLGRSGSFSDLTAPNGATSRTFNYSNSSLPRGTAATFGESPASGSDSTLPGDFATPPRPRQFASVSPQTAPTLFDATAVFNINLGLDKKPSGADDPKHLTLGINSRRNANRRGQRRRSKSVGGWDRR